ncbi:hypothetical protein ZIOFF_073413 [Zingiber officinale]|uniref:Translation initiation factor eIF2B subunit beta n=1 Tax=Zingiber officinale TaxID=94328 RepID=A0A8J5EA80_ZINOF|nr:hypothetical protein ZIOFF_073413 [Zingiber officinale]
MYQQRFWEDNMKFELPDMTCRNCFLWDLFLHFFVVVVLLLQLCPLYPHNPELLLNDFKCPSELLDFGEFSDCMDYDGQLGDSPPIRVENPAFDYVAPKLVSLFITDMGGHSPSYVYRLIADYYSAEDLVVRRKSAP